MAPSKSSDENEGLDWLEGGGEESASPPPAPPLKGSKGAPGGKGAKKGGEPADEVLDWLQSSPDEGGKTLMSPQGGGKKMAKAAEADGELGWLGEEDASETPALLEDDDEGPGTQASESLFSAALDDFFDSIDAKDEQVEGGDTMTAEAAPASDTIASGRTVRSRPDRNKADARLDKIISTLIRQLTRKEPIKAAQIDSIFKLSVGKLVDVVNAEVLLAYTFPEPKKIKISYVFPSKALFKGKSDAEAKFKKAAAKLDQITIEGGTGIVGRACEKKASVTSLDARNDPEFKNYLGDSIDVRTMLTVPLVDGTEVFGALQVMNKDPQSGEEFFSYQDLKLIEEVSGYVARIIHLSKNPKLVTTEDEMARYVARLAKTEVKDLTKADIEWDDRLWEVVGVDAVQKYMILPLKALTSKALSVVMVNPLDFGKRSGFEAATEKTIEQAFVATKAQIQAVLDKKFKKPDPSSKLDTSDLENLAREGSGGVENVEASSTGEDENAAPTIKLVNRIIEDAYARGASDIHIEPYETEVRVRYRCDGNLEERMKLDKKWINPMLSRIKIMANLDIAERRLPQDGKIKFKKFSRTGLDIDLRVATGPMAFGEKCVMRLLVKGSISLGLDAMGFSPQNLEGFRWAAKQPYGMVLCCGPTGSGKTTTLYSALSEVNTVDINIQTAEDPIEYPLHGINQMQMHKDIGLTFSAALKCYMRMDPDVILVGEIRDLETAECAIEASLTGHLLLSTLHTNDAAGTVTRFVEMGVEPFLIASCLLLISAQRLGRRLCKTCKEPWTPTDKEREILMQDPRPIEKGMFKAKEGGCEKCGNSGYKGRVGIHEILCLMGDMGIKIRELINKNVSSDVLKTESMKLGMRTMWQDALWKIKEGLTDLREVTAIVRMD